MGVIMDFDGDDDKFVKMHGRHCWSVLLSQIITNHPCHCIEHMGRAGQGLCNQIKWSSFIRPRWWWHDNMQQAEKENWIDI